MIVNFNFFMIILIFFDNDKLKKKIVKNQQNSKKKKKERKKKKKPQKKKKKKITCVKINSYTVWPRKLKGESVVAAILPSHMEVRYCTTGFFHS